MAKEKNHFNARRPFEFTKGWAKYQTSPSKKGHTAFFGLRTFWPIKANRRQRGKRAAICKFRGLCGGSSCFAGLGLGSPINRQRR